MTRIKKLKVNNFKKFGDRTFEFNDDFNIVVGDNECGKSSLLEAIEICLNYTHRGRPLVPELFSELFNNQCVETYLAGDHLQTSLPNMLIEAYVEGYPKLKGTNNTEGVDAEGLWVKISFDEALAESYAAFIQDKGKLSTIPVELYKVEWFSFAWDKLSATNKGITSLFVDPARLHPTFGRARYINSIINAALDKSARSKLNLNYRQLKVRFNSEPDVVEINKKLGEDQDVTTKRLAIVADIGPSTTWENNLQLAVDDVSFNQIGKGEQSQIQIKIAIHNKAKDVDIVMLEEPENHLSHINLVQLIGYIEKRREKKQIFISTHSSYVLNKLSVSNLCLLSHGYTRLKDVDANAIKTLKRLPGYDTLRAVLARKLILVEGPSDELVLKKLYLNNHGQLPEVDGIDIIVVRGIGFSTYLEIVRPLQHAVHVVKDNDGDHENTIVGWSKPYSDCPFITCFSPTDNAQFSLEPALVEANAKSLDELDRFARIVLAPQKFKEYDASGDLGARKAFLRAWYTTKGSGAKKVDSAIRIFDSKEDVHYPNYLLEALHFAS